MKSKVIMGILLTVLLIGMLTLAFNVQPVKASGSIYIRADGRVEGTTHISSVDNVTYTFTDNIFNNFIVVERSNIIIDGNGYILNGTGNGITVMNPVHNVTIKNTFIKNFNHGILLNLTSYCIISGNLMLDNSCGIGIYNSTNNNMTNNECSNSSIFLSDSSNNTLRNNLCCWGSTISLYGNCSDNTIAKNDIVLNVFGVFLSVCMHNSIMSNNVSQNSGCGIYLEASSNNTIIQNNVTLNDVGIVCDHSATANNTIYHNNFVNNTNQASFNNPSSNTWDDGYPSGGNYWSNYNGTDVKSGPNQDQLGSDGIGDTAHVMYTNNTDHYPLMHPWTPTETIVEAGGVGHPVTITSNTTISGIQATENTLSFTASGPTGETGYILVIFPMVNTSRIRVYINSIEITPPPFPVINTNGTHYFIYFEFTLSTHTITIQFGPTPPVGGIYIPVNKLELLAPYIALTILLVVAVITVGYVKKRKR